MSPIDVPDGKGGTRVSLTKFFSLALILVGTWRGVAPLFGWAGPPDNLEDTLNNMFQALTAVFGGLSIWGLRRAIASK